MKRGVFIILSTCMLLSFLGCLGLWARSYRLSESFFKHWYGPSAHGDGLVHIDDSFGFIYLTAVDGSAWIWSSSFDGRTAAGSDEDVPRRPRQTAERLWYERQRPQEYWAKSGHTGARAKAKATRADFYCLGFYWRGGRLGEWTPAMVFLRGSGAFLVSVASVWVAAPVVAK